MNKLYVIFPVIGVLIFGAFFWSFNADFDAREKAKIEAKRVEHEAKVRADLEAKKKAIEEAIALQEKRKIDLKNASDKAHSDLERVLRQLDRLKIEIGVEDAALKKLATEKATLIADDEFLQKYVKLAEANQKGLEEILVKIEKVDKDAAIAAAQQAKKKS